MDIYCKKNPFSFRISVEVDLEKTEPRMKYAPIHEVIVDYFIYGAWSLFGQRLQ